jgi:Tfp pilus assembly protein PilN
VQRFTLAAWALGTLLAAVNVLLWVQYRHDSTALRGRLAATRAEIEERSANVVRMNGELGGLGLAAQNEQIEFLNQRIAERTFPWSILFERVAATMPDGVRLLGLNPSFRDREQERTRRRERGAPPPAPEDELVDLKIRGVAKSDEDLYQWIDAFFASPAFERPRLYQESSNLAEVQFTVDVQYRPRLQDEPSHRPAAAAETASDAAGEIAAPREAVESDDPRSGGGEEPLEGEDAGDRDPGGAALHERGGVTR